MKKATKMEKFARKYGSVSRVLWMQRQPSVVSGKTPCVNAHVAPPSATGTGYKGDYIYIVPLTDAEHQSLSSIGGGIKTFCERHGVTLDWLREQAAVIEARWQDHLKTGAPAW